VKMKKNEAGNTSLFDYEGKPSWGKSIPLGVQHVLAMIVGNVTPSIMVAAATGMTMDERTLLVQSGFFIAGIATFMQLFAFKKIWREASRHHGNILFLYSRAFSHWI